MKENTLNLEFVRIPEGDFIIGSDRGKDRLAQPDEMPCHELHITDYYLMRFPVTNEQYRQFVEATQHRPPNFGWKDGKFPTERANHPVVGVSLEDAQLFCCWAAQVTGLPLRLPTEPEWEKAARGPDGRIFPWGNEWKPGLCNTSEAKIGETTQVGQHSPAGDSPYGVAEMGGNVQEWCASLFGPYPYDPTDGREPQWAPGEDKAALPQFYETGCIANAQAIEAELGKCVLRGGSWQESKLKSRCAYRGWAAPMHRSTDTGFRCCYDE